MMFTSTNDLEDPIYFMDPYNYSSIPSPLSYFEFDHGSILQWDNTSELPLVDEPISTSSKLGLSKGDINGIVLEQDKGTSFNNGSNKKAVSKRRPSKGDRHSKIATANGLRDRRMRLSLDVARQFFKLQDMLSYDKASKTVKWLLQQAKSAIEELNKGKKSPCEVATKSTASCTSEVEVVESAIDDHEIVNVVPKVETFKEKGMKKRKNESRPVEKQVRRKLREEARERARERTQKKKDDWRLNIELGGCVDEVMSLRGLRNESADSQTRILEPCSDVVFEIEQQIDDERTTFGTTLAVTTSWISSFMSLSYHQEEDSCQVNPIPECQQFHGTSRESYSHPNLGQSWYY